MPSLKVVNTGMFPFPLAPNPMIVLLLAQLKVAPVTGLAGAVSADDIPLQ